MVRTPFPVLLRPLVLPTHMRAIAPVGIRFPAASRFAVDEAYLTDRRAPVLVAPAEGIGLGEAGRPQDTPRTRDHPLWVERV